MIKHLLNAMKLNEPTDFFVQGSAPHPYQVRVMKIQNRLLATCTCQAGVYGQLCKHVTRIINGDTQGVISGNLEEVRNMPAFIEDTVVPGLFQEIKRMEREAESAKLALKKAKNELADSLSGS
jgi:hypothetical protein